MTEILVYILIGFGIFCIGLMIYQCVKWEIVTRKEIAKIKVINEK